MENEKLVWDDFVKDMTLAQHKEFVKLPNTAQLKAFNHWMKTEGQHIDYSY